MTRPETLLRLLLIVIAVMVLVGYWQALPERTARTPEQIHTPKSSQDR